MHADVQRDSVNVAESPFQRTLRIKGTRAGTDVEQVDRLHRAGDSMRGGEPNFSASLHGDFAGRQQRPPQPVNAVEQEQPRRLVSMISQSPIGSSMKRISGAPAEVGRGFPSAWTTHSSTSTLQARIRSPATSGRLRDIRREPDAPAPMNACCWL